MTVDHAPRSPAPTTTVAAHQGTYAASPLYTMRVGARAADDWTSLVSDSSGRSLYVVGTRHSAAHVFPLVDEAASQMAPADVADVLGWWPSAIVYKRIPNEAGLTISGWWEPSWKPSAARLSMTDTHSVGC